MRPHGDAGTGGAAPWLVIRNSPHEGLGVLGRVLRDAGIQYRSINLAQGERAPTDLHSSGGLIVLGGEASVCDLDRHPYLAEECALIDEAITGGRPVLGICLGAQLIAHVLGARVYHGDRREVGWGRVDLTEAGRDDGIFGECTSPLPVFHFHGDSFDLPAGARLLATSPAYERQAFEWGSQVYGLQFHLEFTAEMIERLMADPGTRAYVTEAGADPDSLATDASARTTDLEPTACGVFERFFLHYGGVADVLDEA